MLAGPLPLLPDQPQQRRIGGEQDAPLLEELAGAGEQRGRLLQAARFLEDEAFQGIGLLGAEDGQLEVVANAGLVIRDRMLPGRVPVDRVASMFSCMATKLSSSSQISRGC